MASAPTTARLGTFAGVFTPSILTILGIILFRRMGYVVGAAGVLETLLILGLATLISVLTSLSLSAIATNIKVKKGGDYYLISRTLGLEFGGAIGLVLFLAQAVSIAFYAIGFGEAVAGITGWEHPFAAQGVAAAAVAVLFVLAWFGADIATKFQFVVMAVLIGGLVAFFWGAAESWSEANFEQSMRPDGPKLGFWVIFAIFFPAVTGFTQGVSMSGDLRNPAVSLPRGTFAAVGLSTLIYLAVIVAFAGALPLSTLAADYGAMRQVARFPWLVDAGVIAATLSSAMASFLGAPRILQSLASDKIFRYLTPFAKGHGATENPRRGVMLSFGIAIVTVFAGNLNVLAAVVSMFFLISYGLVNYATYYEARAQSPSFRPRFHWFDRRLSLAGGLICLGAMIAIDWTAAIVSAAILYAIYQYVKRLGGRARWADSSRAHHFQRVRESLLALDAEPAHPRDWRPNILAFSDDPPRREKLLRFASWIEGDSGLTTAVRILVGDGAAIRKERRETEEALKKQVADLGLSCFSLCVASPDVFIGTRMLLQSCGLGPLRVNTLLFNWLEQAQGPGDEERERRYGLYLRAGLRLQRNVVVLEAEEDEWKRLHDTPASSRRIDVWWWNDASSELLLLMAYLMTRTTLWEDATIRVITCVDPELGPDGSRDRLHQTLEDVRIEAEAVVLDELTSEVMIEQSRSATIVLLPMRLRGTDPQSPLGGRIEDLVARLPVTALAIAGEEIDLAAEPDEGVEGEQAAADDRAETAERRADQITAAAEKAAKLADETESKLRDAMARDAHDAIEPLRAAAATARAEAIELEQREKKARARAEKAATAPDPKPQVPPPASAEDAEA